MSVPYIHIVGPFSLLWTDDNRQRLRGPYGKLCSLQEVQAALLKMQRELAAADKPLLQKSDLDRYVRIASSAGSLQWTLQDNVSFHVLPSGWIFVALM